MDVETDHILYAPRIFNDWSHIRSLLTQTENHLMARYNQPSKPTRNTFSSNAPELTPSLPSPKPRNNWTDGVIYKLLHFKNVFIRGRMSCIQMNEWKMYSLEEDCAENGWTTSRNGVEKKSTHSTGRRRIAACGERCRIRHWTPTGAEPMEQWMDGYIH